MSQELISSIQEEVKISLKSGDKFKASTLRLIVSELKLEEKNKSSELTSEESVTIMAKMIKQRKDSITQFESANRLELAQKEKDFQKKILRVCLLYTSPSPRDRQKSRMPSSA